jgi:hypothetical protein
LPSRGRPAPLKGLRWPSRGRAGPGEGWTAPFGGHAAPREGCHGPSEGEAAQRGPEQPPRGERRPFPGPRRPPPGLRQPSRGAEPNFRGRTCVNSHRSPRSWIDYKESRMHDATRRGADDSAPNSLTIDVQTAGVRGTPAVCLPSWRRARVSDSGWEMRRGGACSGLAGAAHPVETGLPCHWLAEAVAALPGGPEAVEHVPGGAAGQPVGGVAVARPLRQRGFRDPADEAHRGDQH